MCLSFQSWYPSPAPLSYCQIIYLRWRRSCFTLFPNDSHKSSLSPLSFFVPEWWPKKPQEGSPHRSFSSLASFLKLVNVLHCSFNYLWYEKYQGSKFLPCHTELNITSWFLNPLVLVNLLHNVSFNLHQVLPVVSIPYSQENNHPHKKRPMWKNERQVGYYSRYSIFSALLIEICSERIPVWQFCIINYCFNIYTSLFPCMWFNDLFNMFLIP